MVEEQKPFPLNPKGGHVTSTYPQTFSKWGQDKNILSPYLYNYATLGRR